MWYARSGHCRGQDAPDSRKDALCWRKPLRVVRPVAIRLLHLLPVVHDEGGAIDQERRGETKYRRRMTRDDVKSTFASLSMLAFLGCGCHNRTMRVVHNVAAFLVCADLPVGHRVNGP